MTGRASALCLLLGLVLLAFSAALLMHNRQEVRQARQASEQILTRVRAADSADTPPEPAASSSTTEEVFGVLSVPALALELPVLSVWSETGLTEAPCRQQGSASSGLVIAGHNYASHFGSLSRLASGDAVTLTLPDGAVYRYTVACVRQVAAEDTEAILSAAEPLVLYTCTYGGKARVAVFCERDTA